MLAFKVNGMACSEDGFFGRVTIAFSSLFNQKFLVENRTSTKFTCRKSSFLFFKYSLEHKSYFISSQSSLHSLILDAFLFPLFLSILYSQGEKTKLQNAGTANFLHSDEM